MEHYAPTRCEPSIEALNLGGSGEGGVRADVNGEMKFLVKIKKKWEGEGGLGGQGGCERRIEVFVKVHIFFFWGGGVGSARVGGSGWGSGDQGGCERIIEVSCDQHHVIRFLFPCT